MHSKLRKWAGVALATASAMLLSACAAGGPAAPGSSEEGAATEGRVLRIGTSTEVVAWAPLNSASITDMWVMNQMYPPLNIMNEDGTLTPHLATEMTVSDDGSSVTIKLDPNFKWSDGEPITAEDVQFTLDRIRDNHLISASGLIANYDSTEVVDDQTAVVKLTQPSIGWAMDLERTNGIIPEHIFNKFDDLQTFSLEANPETWVSGGAFTLSNVVPGQRYEFVPNPNYPYHAEGNEAVTGIEFTIYGEANTMQLALRNGDIDIMGPVVPSSAIGELQTQPNIKITTAKEALNYTKLSFNGSQGPLADPEIRQAISGLIDTEAIVTNVLQGHAATTVGPVLPAFTDFQPDIKPYSSTPEQVKTLLEQKGFPNPTLKLICDQGNASHAKSSQLIRDMLAPAGINVDVKCAERATSLAAAKAGEFDLYVHKLNQADSPSTSLFKQFDPSNPSKLNYNFLPEDVKGGELIAAAQNASDETEYQNAVKEAAKYIHEQAYILPLYVEYLNTAYNTSTFTGYVPTPVETSTMVNGYSLAQVVPSN